MYGYKHFVAAVSDFRIETERKKETSHFHFSSFLWKLKQGSFKIWASKLAAEIRALNYFWELGIGTFSPTWDSQSIEGKSLVVS